MGAIHHGLDLNLVRALRKRLPLRVFVETGTFEGGTAIAVAPYFERVLTIELAPALFQAATLRLAGMPSVEVAHGASPRVLHNRAEHLRTQSVLYWLDAHWSGGVTAGLEHECPVLDELEALSELNGQSAVLIDDARLFLAPPPAPHDPAHWPGLLQLAGGLQRLSSGHGLWVINDVIVFAPSSAAPDIIQYHREFGRS